MVELACKLKAPSAMPSAGSNGLNSATIETRTAMSMLALDNVDAVLNARPAPTLIQASSQWGIV